MIFERLQNTVDGRSLLSYGDINADNVFSLLIDDGIDGDGCLSRLPVSDNEFALSFSDGDHAVDCFYTRLKGLVDVCAVENGGGGSFHRTSL